MGKPRGSIGETKWKIMAIVCHDEALGYTSYGYGIWKKMKENYHSCLGEDGLRNVYHHLKDLYNLELIRKISIQSVEGAPERSLYGLTEKGRGLKDRFSIYLTVLKKSS